MSKEDKEIELKKIELRLNLYKELFKALLFVLVADIGGTVTIILNVDRYSTSIAYPLIALGIFVALGFLYALLVILFYIAKLKEKLED